MTEYLYQNYQGPEAFLFFGCDTSGKDRAAGLANRLAGDGVRLFFACTGEQEKADRNANPADTAEAVGRSAGCVLFLTKKAVSRLEFRNIVNFSLNEHKKLICFLMEEFALSDGMDMQLANICVEKWESEEEALELLKKRQLLTQEVIGTRFPAERKVSWNKRLLLIGLLILLVLGFLLGAAQIVQKRIAYYQSPAYILQDADGSSYLNASAYGQEGLDALSGMKITELNLAGAGLTNVEALSGMRVEVLDISDNPLITDLFPLKQCEGLRQLKISQDMLDYAYMVRNSGFDIIVTR